MFDELLTWCLNNKQWLLSGIGTVTIVAIIRFIVNNRQSTSSQIIRSGNNSTNIQAGSNIHLATNVKENDNEEK